MWREGENVLSLRASPSLGVLKYCPDCTSKKDLEAERNQQKLMKWFKPKAEEVEPPPWRPEHVEAVIEGDGKVPSISAASVLAKVRRDQLMDALHQRFPAYGFASHKGYGTEEHMEAIKQHGVCPEHRRSFGPVREIIEAGTNAD